MLWNRRCLPWESTTIRRRRNFGLRWSSWSKPAARQRSLRASSSRRAQTIYNWVAQADRDTGKRHDGLTTAEHEELTRLRHKVRQLELEREILSKAAAWFAQETGTVPEKGSNS